MMELDKATERLGNKLIDTSVATLTKAAKQISEALMFFILSAAATATDPFFRKNMGERYFTPLRVVISFIGWIALFLITSIFKSIVYDNPSPLSMLIAALIPMVYMTVSVFNLAAIYHRRANGEIWHSRSRGESVFGREDLALNVMIELIVLFGLCFVSIPHALFFLMSRLMSYAADAMAQAALYHRYLDIVDATIEAECMETVLRDGLPPRKTAGLYGPLPRYIKGERRANIARIVTGGPFIKDTKVKLEEKPQAAPQNPVIPQSSRSEAMSRTSSQEVDLESASQNSFPTAKETLFNILKSKPVIRVALIGLILVALTAAGLSVVWFISTHLNPPAPATVATTQRVQSPTANPIPSTPSVSKIPNPLPPVAAPANEAKNNGEDATSAALAQTALEAQQRQEAEKAAQKAKDQAALEAQQHQEQEKAAALAKQKQQEREKMLEQIMTTVADQETQRSKLLVDCEMKLANNTNKIAKLARSSREVLIHNNNSAKQAIETMLKAQEDAFKQIQASLPPLFSNPQSDARPLGTQLTNYMAKVERGRQHINDILADLDTDISKAPKRMGIFDIQVK